jgi:hypothetical protein
MNSEAPMIPKGSKMVARGKLAQRVPPLETKRAHHESKAHPGGMLARLFDPALTWRPRTALASLRDAPLGESYPRSSSRGRSTPGYLLRSLRDRVAFVILHSAFASLRSLLRSSTRFAVLAVSLCSAVMAAHAAEPTRQELWVPTKNLDTVLKAHPNAVMLSPEQYEALIRDAGKVKPEDDPKTAPPKLIAIEGLTIHRQGGAERGECDGYRANSRCICPRKTGSARRSRGRWR